MKKLLLLVVAAMMADDECQCPDWQVSALGIEFGGAQLRGYIEGGFGTQGFALAGIRYKF